MVKYFIIKYLFNVWFENYGVWKRDINTPSVFPLKKLFRVVRNGFFNAYYKEDKVLTLFQIQFALDFVHKYVLNAFIERWNDGENAI